MTEPTDPSKSQSGDSSEYGFTLENLNAKHLQAGDYITELDKPDAMTELEAKILIAMGDDVTYGIRFSNPSARHTLKDELRPTKFNGKLINTHALVLSGFDPDAEYDYSRGVPDLDQISMLIAADMKSTGRKDSVGTTSIVVTYTRNTSKRGVNRQISRLKAGDVSEKLMDSLNWESSAARHVLTSIALDQTVLAGLPTLGKNR